MTYTSQFTETAREAILRLPPEVKQRIKQGIRFLCEDPYAGEPLKRELEGKRKLRMGHYRIVHQLEPSRRVVVIVAVGHRRDVYKQLSGS